MISKQISSLTGFPQNKIDIKKGLKTIQYNVY